MAIFAHQYHHWAYVWIPVFGAFIWCGTLLSMIIVWAAMGKPHFPNQDSTIPFISDIGAGILKPLFISGSSVTAVCFFLSIVIERWLRHNGRLLPYMRKRERVFASLAILGSFIGSLALILLSIFDKRRHKPVHDSLLLVFIIGVGLSAIFTIIEFRWLSKDFYDASRLRRAYIAKGVIAGTLILLAIVFGSTLFNAVNVAAVIEWVIGFGFTLYILTYYYDLRMSKGMHKGQLSRERLTEMGQVRIR